MSERNNVSTSTVLIKWERPRELLSGYKVSYKAIEIAAVPVSNATLHEVVLDDSSTTIQITDLESYTTYNITVTPIARSGVRMKSKYIHAGMFRVGPTQFSLIQLYNFACSLYNLRIITTKRSHSHHDNQDYTISGTHLRGSHYLCSANFLPISFLDSAIGCHHFKSFNKYHPLYQALKCKRRARDQGLFIHLHIFPVLNKCSCFRF